MALDDELAVRRERRRLRAVVADDDAGMRRLLAAVLELEGWEVSCASNGDEAVALAEACKADAVLLDLRMPGTDGIAALRQLRRGPGGEDRAVVVVSGVTDQGARDAAADAGCDDYLVKPIDVEAMPERVLRLLKAPSRLAR